jgi:hypothetical protein
VFGSLLRKKNKEEILTHTKQNREEVLASETCGCLKCGAVFTPQDIKDWTPPETVSEQTRDLVEEGGHGHRRRHTDPTAICPHCGEAMVLGDHSGHRVSPAMLETLRSHMRT